MRKHKKNNRHVQMIVGLSICLLLIMTVGYAAFSTNITLTAKGKILKNTTFKALIKEVVTTGNGLYVDPVTENRYVYRGATPNNYINFNNETWRILSIEADGTAKIMKQENIGSRSYDSSGNRGDSTYCSYSSWPNYGQNIGSKFGCNAWTNDGGTFTNGGITGTVINEASLNVYLNGEYYNSFSTEIMAQIQTHNFYYGSSSTADLKTLSTQEQARVWNGNVALVNVTDYMKASLVDACSLEGGCKDNNYIYTDIIGKNLFCWTMNSSMSNSIIVLGLYNGILNSSFPKNFYYVYPVVYLKDNLILTGCGTQEDPYKVKSRN